MLERWQATSASVRGAGIFETGFLATRTAEVPASPSAARISFMRYSGVDRATLCIPRTQRNTGRENVLAADDALAEVQEPGLRAGTRSTYHKIIDREAWTHAVVSAAIVLEMDKQVCRSARIVLGGVAPIPWRLAKV